MIVVTGLQAPDSNKQVKCIIKSAVNHPPTTTQLLAVDVTDLMNLIAYYHSNLKFSAIITTFLYQQDLAMLAAILIGPTNRLTNCVEMEFQVMYIRTVMERRRF